jgi:hypothetical protein
MSQIPPSTKNQSKLFEKSSMNYFVKHLCVVVALSPKDRDPFFCNLGPGTPPNEIVAIPMINEVLDVEWTAPEEPNGEITGYIIHYGEVPEGNIACFKKLKKTCPNSEVARSQFTV